MDFEGTASLTEALQPSGASLFLGLKKEQVVCRFGQGAGNRAERPFESSKDVSPGTVIPSFSPQLVISVSVSVFVLLDEVIGGVVFLERIKNERIRCFSKDGEDEIVVDGTNPLDRIRC